MKRVFLSYASPDMTVAEHLAGDLRNMGHSVFIDTEEVKVGSDFVNFINQNLERADAVLLLITKNTESAKWQQKEINAATTAFIEAGKTLLIVRGDLAPIPPLLTSIHRVEIGSSDESRVKALAEIAKSLGTENLSASSVVDRIEKSTSNPFWRIRAEYYTNEPNALAGIFSQPEAQKWITFKEMHPTILEGSRGTGKTMLLMALRARNYAPAHQNPTDGIGKVFGFYLRLMKGAFSSIDPDSLPKHDAKRRPSKAQSQAIECFSQEFHIAVIESFIDEIVHCIHAGHIKLDPRREDSFAVAMRDALNLPRKSSDRDGLEGILDSLVKKRLEASDYITSKFIYGGKPPVPALTRFNLVAVKALLAMARRHLPELSGTQMTLLLDEYENLFDAQKPVINSLIKLGPPDLSIKIARKSGTTEIAGTIGTHPIEQPHDYNRINLVYHLEDQAQRNSYFNLLAVLTRNALRQAGLRTNSARDFLPQLTESILSAAEVREEVRLLVGNERWERLNDIDRDDRVDYYRFPASLRTSLRRRGTHRNQYCYAGFEVLAYLSSGVIRYFQQILGTAFHLQYGESRPSSDDAVVIQTEHQSRAVYLVSEHNLSALSRGVGSDGERLKYLLVDLGDILRQKLLSSSSEPEAGRLGIANPLSLNELRNRELRDLLTMGVQEGVFQERDGRPGMRPKHHSDPQPHEFNIARVFAPALQFSYRLRWRSEFRTEELSSLIDSSKRKDALTKLLKRASAPPRNDGQDDMFSV